MHGDEWNQQRRHDRADVRAAIKNASCKSTLTGGKPIGDGLDRGWKIRSLAGAQHESCGRKLPGISGQRVRHRSQAPDHDGQRIADACPQPVDDASGDGHHGGVSALKGEHHPAEVGFVPAKLPFEDGLQNTEDLAVDVVDSGREEQQPADIPAEVADGPWPRSRVRG